MTKLCLVGIDGLRIDIAAEPGLAPTLMSLAETGSLTPVEMTPPTDSGPGWASILTGQPHHVTNVYDNEFVAHNLGRCPDILSRVFWADHQLNTLAAVSWPPLADPSGPGPIIHTRPDQRRARAHRIIIRDGETYGYRGADRQILTEATTILQNDGPDASFIYFGEVDEAGHSHGAKSHEYRDAISRIDEHLRYIVKALQERIGRHSEDWLLAVTTDHGHKPDGGHGEDEPEVTGSFLVLHRFGLPCQADSNAMDPTQIAPLLLRLTGLA